MANTKTRLEKIEEQLTPNKPVNFWVVMDGVATNQNLKKEIRVEEFEKLNIPSNQVIEVIFQ